MTQRQAEASPLASGARSISDALAGILEPLAPELGAGPRAHAPSPKPAGIFGGLGTWIDLTGDTTFRDPGQIARAVAARNVHTVFVRAGGHSHTKAIPQARALGEFVDALHAHGVCAVGVYEAGFAQVERDLDRTRELLSFTTNRGVELDGLTIDCRATVVPSAKMRTARLRSYLRTVRDEADAVPLGVVALPPRLLERRQALWPEFPWREMTELFADVLVLIVDAAAMRGYDATYGFVARSLAAVRAEVGADPPLHVGAVTRTRPDPDAFAAFAQAIADSGTVGGWSVDDFLGAVAAQWQALGALAGAE